MTEASKRDAISVRPFSRFDLAGVELIFQDAYKAADWDLPPYDPAHCWMQLIDLGRQGLVMVAEKEGKIVGVLALQVANWPWNPKATFLENIHFFVAPEHRGNGVAGKLLDSAEALSKNSGLGFRLAATFGTEPELLERWCRMRGYKVTGSNLWYHVK